MRLQGLFGRSASIQLAVFFGQRIPAWASRRLSRWAASIVCRLRPEVYRNLQGNLAHVLGPDAGAEEVHQKACQVFYHFVLGYFDFFRALRLPQEKVRQMVEVPETLQAVLHSGEVRAGGLVMDMCHTGNFDLAGRMMTFYAPSVQVISLPNPHGGFQSLNELRREGGAVVTPLGPAALRQALKTLRAGGLVATGGDRPVSGLDDPILFFGRPAHMPSGHVRLALKTGAIVVVGGCVYHPGKGSYLIDVEAVLEMVHTGDREEEVRLNMRRVLDAMEAFIRRWSDQWMMFVPVWPESTEV